MLQITPPPGFGGPVSNGPISNGTTPSASNHTSIDSATALGVDADTLRAAARMSAAAAAAQQQGGGGEQKVEGYSPFAAFGAAAPGSSSMYSSLGSSGSLMDRLPSTGDLLAAGAEVRQPWVQGSLRCVSLDGCRAGQGCSCSV